MVKSASLFSQLLQHFPRSEFARLVHVHGAEYRAKGFGCWTQFVSMLFCQLARADSLREICNGLACCLGRLVHLGVGRPPSKSTLSYANAHRPAALFEGLFWAALKRFRAQKMLGHRKSRFRFKNQLLSLDSTTIRLCLNLFPWAEYRRSKGGVKTHVLLDHDDYLPVFVHITDAKQHDIRTARKLMPPAGSIVCMDRGYNDYRLFSKWTNAQVFFVTRQRTTARFRVVKNRPIPQNRNVLRDQLIRLTGEEGVRLYGRKPLRRIEVWDESSDQVIVLLSNHLHFGSTTLAAIYKDRWEIELFFKALKQNLKIKTFVGTSENALRIQIWTALTAMLLLKWMHYISRAGLSFKNLACLLRLNLFTYRDLLEWIHRPFDVPPIRPVAIQLPLPLGQPPP